MTDQDREILTSMHRQVDQIHTTMFGVEGQGGMIRKLDKVEETIVVHAKEDKDFQLKIEDKFQKERLNMFKLILASTGMGGLAGKIASWFN